MNTELLQKSGLSLERLDSFCKIVDAGGLSQAAEAHHVRVSKLSRQVSDLEEYFGVDLMLRTRHGMSPTELGKEFYNIIQHDLRLLENFRAKCAGQPALIRITASNSLIHWTVAPRLAALAKRLPKMRFDIRAQPTHERLPALRNHECDFAIVRRETVSKQLKSRPLLTIHYRLFVHRQLLVKAGKLDTNKLLENLPLALPPHGDFRRKLDQSAEQHHINPSVVLDVGSFTMAARAVQTGQFAAILPHIAARDFPDKEFAILTIPLLSGYAPNLHLCWDPKLVRFSEAADKARPSLLELLGGE